MRRRDGVFKRNGWWWIDYEDAGRRRHREKAAPSYEVAKLVYRDRMNAIAKGEVSGMSEEGVRLRDFVKRKYRPTKAKEAPGRVRYLTAEELELLLNGRSETVKAPDGRTWMAGVSQRAVMAMWGHKDPRMTVRYQDLSPEHLHDAAGALDTRPHERPSTGTISAPARSRGCG